MLPYRVARWHNKRWNLMSQLHTWFVFREPYPSRSACHIRLYWSMGHICTFHLTLSRMRHYVEYKLALIDRPPYASHNVYTVRILFTLFNSALRSTGTVNIIAGNTLAPCTLSFLYPNKSPTSWWPVFAVLLLSSPSESFSWTFIAEFLEHCDQVHL